jgi:hypothetical protein
MSLLKIMPFYKNMSLLKNRPVIALTLGVALVAIALLRVPLAAQAKSQIGAGEGQPHCPVAEIALDSGYGLTRKELRPHCAAE